LLYFTKPFELRDYNLTTGIHKCKYSW